MATRRTFLKNIGFATGASLIPGTLLSSCGNNSKNRSTNKMKLTFKPYDLTLKHVFTIAGNSRTTTPVMLTEIEYEGFTGYGEASMPPYLGENHKTAAAFLSKVDLSQFKNPFDLETILTYVDSIAPGNCAAKAAVDIALHDLLGKLMNQPWFNIWGFPEKNTPETTFTIGIDKPDVVKQKVKEAEEFKILKVKISETTDKMMIDSLRSVSNVKFCVDVNQGWKDKKYALEMCHWLKEKGCVFVEQPLPKKNLDDIAWLSQNSPLPIVADEAVQRLCDVEKLYQVYSGINIKLMKCTGMREAHKMVNMARTLGMRVMIGCMTETSVGISAAAQLSPMVEWADLDGNLLISNDNFDGVKVIDGKITLNNRPGIGVKPIS